VNSSSQCLVVRWCLYLGAHDAVDRGGVDLGTRAALVVGGVVVSVAAVALLHDHLWRAVVVRATHGLQITLEHTATATATATAAAVLARLLDAVDDQCGRAEVVSAVAVAVAVAGEVAGAVGVRAVALVVLAQLVVGHHHLQRVYCAAVDGNLQ
jgi:Na+/H+-dicarboxylate symporter